MSDLVFQSQLPVFIGLMVGVLVLGLVIGYLFTRRTKSVARSADPRSADENLYLAFSSALPAAGEALQLLLGRASPEFFGPGEISALILLGAGLGVGGSVLSLVRLEDSP